MDRIMMSNLSRDARRKMAWRAAPYLTAHQLRTKPILLPAPIELQEMSGRGKADTEGGWREPLMLFGCEKQ
jgi:hypothetical protein